MRRSSLILTPAFVILIVLLTGVGVTIGQRYRRECPGPSKLQQGSRPSGPGDQRVSNEDTDGMKAGSAFDAATLEGAQTV